MINEFYKQLLYSTPFGGFRGKGKYGIVLELSYYINTVFGLLKLYSTPSWGGVNTLYPPSPLFEDGTAFKIQVNV